MSSTTPDKLSSTDWTLYYQTPNCFAALTRAYTGWRIAAALRRILHRDSSFTIAELGGANSCVMKRLMRRVGAGEYVILDSNSFGLELTKYKHHLNRSDQKVKLIHIDLLPAAPVMSCSLVLSLGLIEHFDREKTAIMIERHFQIADNGGWVLFTFPTPTLIYRTVRKVLENLGLWKFPDERPLHFTEVNAVATRYGSLQYAEILWPIGLTQQLALYRKHL